MLPRPQRPDIGFSDWISSSNVKCLGTALQFLGHCRYTLHCLTSAASIFRSSFFLIPFKQQRQRNDSPFCCWPKISVISSSRLLRPANIPATVVHNFDCFFALQTCKMISFDQQQYNSVRLVSSTNSWLLLCAIVCSKATNDPGSSLPTRVSFSNTRGSNMHKTQTYQATSSSASSCKHSHSSCNILSHFGKGTMSDVDNLQGLLDTDLAMEFLVPDWVTCDQRSFQHLSCQVSLFLTPPSGLCKICKLQSCQNAWTHAKVSKKRG